VNGEELASNTKSNKFHHSQFFSSISDLCTEDAPATITISTLKKNAKLFVAEN
jgi:hypothetical protein